MTLQQVIRDRLAHLVRTVPVKGRWRAAGTLNRLFRAEPAAARLPGVGQVLLDLRHEDQSQVYWAGLSRDNSLILDTLRAALPPGGVFLDAGANLGLHTLAIAHHLRPSGGSVLAFEPHPDNYLALRENIVRNGLDNVVAQEVGLAESPGSHTGAAPPGPGNWSVASEGPRRFKIDLIRFDDFARNTHLHRLDAVKIDVEGAEVRVLRGARESIARFRPVIVFEVCPMWLRRMGTSVAELFEVVQGPGYTIHDLPQRGTEWGRPLQAVDMDRLGPGEWANLVAVLTPPA